MGGYDGVPELVYVAGNNAKFAWENMQLMREYCGCDAPENLMEHYGVDDVLKKQFKQTPIQMCMTRKMQSLKQICDDRGLNYEFPLMFCNNVYGVEEFLHQFGSVAKHLAKNSDDDCVCEIKLDDANILLKQILELIDIAVEEDLNVLIKAEMRYAEAAKKLYKLFKLINNIDVNRYLATMRTIS